MLAPSEEVGLSFSCNGGYDWDERCYRDEGARLPVGGVDDKVWRSALRFSLASLPPDATIASAELRAYHDGVCVAPRRTSTACSARPSTGAHRIFASDCGRRRDPEVDESPIVEPYLEDARSPQWPSWDVTGLVGGWHTGLVANGGVLLELSADEEEHDAGGPYIASASHPDAALRPRLVVTHTAAG